MKPTRLARRLWTLTAIRRCLASALRYNRTAARLQCGDSVNTVNTRNHYEQTREWCITQLMRLSYAG